jgi:hypothetical protein
MLWPADVAGKAIKGRKVCARKLVKTVDFIKLKVLMREVESVVVNAHPLFTHLMRTDTD